jgi:hypothetical protein
MSAQAHILVVDDEAHLAAGISENLATSAARGSRSCAPRTSTSSCSTS